MNENHIKQLGKPDVQVSGLQIWIHGRQFPDLNDYWDGNWLRATVHCKAKGSSVWVSGPIIHLSELHGWLVSTQAMNESLKGEANLDCMEPELSVSLKAEGLGHINMEVNITPDHLSQDHKYHFEIDQSYLSELIKSCQAILQRYPVRGSNEISGT